MLGLHKLHLTTYPNRAKLKYSPCKNLTLTTAIKVVPIFGVVNRAPAFNLHLHIAFFVTPKSDRGAWSLLLLAATVWSFAHLPLGLSDRNNTKYLSDEHFCELKGQCLVFNTHGLSNWSIIELECNDDRIAFAILKSVISLNDVWSWRWLKVLCGASSGGRKPAVLSRMRPFSASDVALSGFDKTWN